MSTLNDQGHNGYQAHRITGSEREAPALLGSKTKALCSSHAPNISACMLHFQGSPTPDALGCICERTPNAWQKKNNGSL